MIQTAASKKSRWTDAMFGVVSSRARRRYEQHRAESDPAYFDQIYQELTTQRFAQKQRSARPMRGELESQVARAAAELRQNGVFFWRGLFADPAWLERAKAQMQQIVDRWEEAFEQRRSTEKTLGDPQKDVVLVRGNRAQNGRLRATIQRTEVAPECFREVMQHPGLKEAVSRYFDAESGCNYLLVERLSPSDRGDFWHVDRIVDQVKMMVLLTDVGPKQGPLRLKVGTHTYQPQLKPLYYSVFSHGVDYAYPPGPLVEQLPGEIVVGHGKAGDCILFDTLAVHSGSECIEGERDVLVGTWYGPTCRTQKLQSLSSPRWI